MKTKEEILDKQVENGTTGGTKDAMKRYGRFDCRIIHAAMEDYAKQQAIAFQDWTARNPPKYQKGQWARPDKIYERPPTPEKMYDQFIEHQQSTDNKKQ